MYKSLQAGRAAAAVAVLLFHLGSTLATPRYFGLPAFAIPFSFGISGVGFFFVLSGFIIMTVHRKDISAPSRLGRFVRKRFVRIYPTYWVILGAMCVTLILWPGFNTQLPAGVASLLKMVFLIPEEGRGRVSSPVLGAAWTLRYEILFYAFFACLILNRFLGLFVGALWLAFIVGFSFQTGERFPYSLFSSPYALLFFMGMGVSVIHESRRFVVRRPMALLWGGAAIFTLLCIGRLLHIGFVSHHRALLFGTASAVLILGLVQAERAGVSLGGGKVVQLLGAASYALYLIHYPLVAAFCKISMALGFRSLGYLGGGITFFVALCGCLSAAIAFHLWIERPLLQRLSGRSRTA
jgi:exopolysaccharide production protein ExoZ